MSATEYEEKEVAAAEAWIDREYGDGLFRSFAPGATRKLGGWPRR